MELTPIEFYEGFVLEDYEDWKEARCSVRKCMHSAVSATHLADHYFEYHKLRVPSFAKRFKELATFQERLRLQDPAFKVVQDVARAYKQLYPRASCSIASGGAITTIVTSDEKIESHWAVDRKLEDVLIRHRDGTQSRFSYVIERTIDMWDWVLHENNPGTLSIAPGTA